MDEEEWYEKQQPIHLSMSKSVLDLKFDKDGLVTFDNFTGEEDVLSESLRSVMFTTETWIAFGEPTELTITLEPGNKIEEN